MKKIFVTIISVLALFPSCNNFLDKEPDDMLTLPMIFNDRQRVQEFLANNYGLVPDGFISYSRNFGCTFISDDAQIALGMAAANAYWKWPVNYNQGSINSTQRPQEDIWSQMYQRIRACYVTIENVHTIPDQNFTEADVEQVKMECKFLIAYYHHKLLELYGPVPLMKQSVPSDAPIESLLLARTPVDEMVEWIANEYTQCAAFFPPEVENPATDVGRPTKGICLALKARLYLYAASPLFNGNSDYKDLKNPDGTVLFNQTYDKNKWKLAVDATREFLDLAETGIYELYKEYNPDGTIDPFLSMQNLFLTQQGNKEIIFQRTKNEYNWYQGITNPRSSVGHSGYYGSTQNMADAFFMKNGLSPIEGYNDDGSPIINEASGYTESGFVEEPIFYENTQYDQSQTCQERKTPGYVVDPGTFNMYANREPRFYTSLWYNNEYIPITGEKTNFMYEQKDGGPTYDAPACCYLTKKMENPAADKKNNKVPYQTSILLRLAEFYLNYAEALNEWEPGNPDIIKYVNLVRERAGIPLYGTKAGEIAFQNDQESVRKLIRKERRVEFAIEGDVRFNDIRRWKIAVELFKTPIYGMNASGRNNEDFYRRTVYMQRTFNTREYFFPIYQTYLDNNPNLVQNYGW